MRAVSNAWLRTVEGTYTPQYRATICDFYQTTNQPSGRRIPIVEGSVTLDAAADVYGSLDLTVPGAYWPEPTDDTGLAPTGVEVYVQVGVRYSDALVEWLGLGYFRVRSVGQDDSTRRGDVRVSGQDRMAGIVKATMVRPVAFAATDTVGTFVSTLAAEVYPDIVITYDDNMDTQQLGRAVVVDDDRYLALAGIAEAYGKRMRFDASGELAFITPSNPRYPTIQLRGGRGGSLVAAPRELSDEGVVNAVVVRGGGADPNASAYGVAFDNNTRTGYTSRFGPSPKAITNSLIVNDSQASAAALAELRRHIGIPYTVGFTISPRPELQPDDAFALIHDGLTSDEYHIISSVKIPLAPGQVMTGGTRQQAVAVLA